MKFSALALVPLLASPSMSFSMLKRYDFPKLSTYLKEIDAIFDREWPTAFFEKQLDRMDKEMKEMETGLAFRRASPRYEVLEDEDKFEVSVDVPGYKRDEINVDVKAGGRVLCIAGEHKEEEEGRSMSSKFQQNFSLDPTVQTDQITANLSEDGTLVVTAPRHPQLPENRNIPVIEAKAEAEEKPKP